MSRERATSSGVLPVLMYHSVPTGGVGDALTVPLPRLREQLGALREAGWELFGQTRALQTKRRDPDARVVGLTFDDGYADFLGAVPVLAALGAGATLYLPTKELQDGAGRFLTWPQVSGLPEDVVEIGSHGSRHMPLDVLDGHDLDEQVHASRRELQDRTGQLVVSFCYPNGYAGARVRRAVAAAGYDNACIIGRRVATLDDDPLLLPRLQVTGTHSGADVVQMLVDGEGRLVPTLKRAAQPAWRLVRQAVYRTSGRVLT